MSEIRDPSVRPVEDGDGRQPSTGSSVVVRAAAEADLPEMLAIENASFASPWSERTFRHLLSRENARLLSAVHADGRVLGYAVLWFAGGEGELGDLAVHPESRGLGIADRLLESVLEEAAGRGAGTLYLEVRTGNVAALGLYRKHGFEIVGRRAGYYTRPVEDALIMRRLLAR